MTYDRAKFRQQGCYFTDIGERFYWKDSYHEGEKLQFVTAKTTWKCDECNTRLAVGDLISVGTRQFYPDAPIYISGIDRVHLKCYRSDEFETDPDDCLFGKKVTEIDGYGALSAEQKTKWLQWQKIEVNEDNLNAGDVAALKGKVFMVIGLFDDKDAVRDLINTNGGGLADSYNKQVTHCVLGKSGKSKYGQKTGKGSKKYRDLKKKKVPIVSLDELHEMIRTAQPKMRKKAEIETEEEEQKEKAENPQTKNEKKRKKMEEEQVDEPLPNEPPTKKQKK